MRPSKRWGCRSRPFTASPRGFLQPSVTRRSVGRMLRDYEFTLRGPQPTPTQALELDRVHAKIRWQMGWSFAESPLRFTFHRGRVPAPSAVDALRLIRGALGPTTTHRLRVKRV